MASARVVQNAIDKLNGTKLNEKDIQFKSGKRWVPTLDGLQIPIKTVRGENNTQHDADERKRIPQKNRPF